MSNDRTIPTAESQDLSTHTIVINGNEISRTYQVSTISVNKEINRIPYARIVMLDGDAAASDFPGSNSDDFLPGNEIEILAGYHSDEATIFKGIIVKHGIKMRKEGSAQLIIECRDQAYKMTGGRKNRYFYEITDSEVIEEIVGEYELASDIVDSNVTHTELVQYDITDWDFIMTRAEVSGLLCTVDDGNVIFQTPDTAQEAALTLEYGATLLEFDAEIDVRNQYTTVKSKGWDFTNQEVVELEAAEPSLSLNGNLSVDDLSNAGQLEEYVMSFAGKTTEEALQSWADARLLRNHLSKTRGRARFQGIHTMKPTMLVELKGVGDRFNGNCFVSGVHHSISDGQWTTDIQFGLDPEWFTKKVSFGVQSDLLANSILGLQVGKVVQLEKDPSGEDRILVKLPIVDPDEEGVWARLACLDAGKERGTFFRPEVDDEVIVGFINADLSSPVILGMLHSSAHPTPQEITADNNEKGYITRSKMKFLFDDDKKSICLETPAGKKVVIDEDAGEINFEDENNNKIVMNADGITIESGADLNIKASGDTKIEGTNIECDAKSGFTGKGSTGAELSAQGSVTISGQVVQIN